MKKLLCFLLLLSTGLSLFGGDDETIRLLLDQLNQESFIISHPDLDYSCIMTARITLGEQNSGHFQLNSMVRIRMTYQDGYTDTEELETLDLGNRTMDDFIPPDLEGNPFLMSMPWEMDDLQNGPLRFSLDREEQILHIKYFPRSPSERDNHGSGYWVGKIFYDPQEILFTKVELNPAVQDALVEDSSLVLETAIIEGRRCISAIKMRMVYHLGEGSQTPMVLEMTMDMDQYRIMR